MKRKHIKEIIKFYGYRMIKPSWYVDKENESALFNAYDEHGFCHQWYVNWSLKKARKQMLSDVQILKETDVAYMFWEGVK